MTVPPRRLVLSSFKTGYETYEKPFLLNNDAFPLVQNATLFRERIEKKPGAAKLGRLSRVIDTTDVSGNASIAIDPSPNPTALASGIVSFSIGSQYFIDGGGASPVTLTTSGIGTAQLNRTTTVLTVTGAAPNTSIIYYPSLPGMGIESFESDTSESAPIDLPVNVFFDTTYAYQYSSTTNAFFDVSFYKTNDALITPAPITWTGQNYQQFYSANYFGAMFATNDSCEVGTVAGAFNFSIESVSGASPPVITLVLPTGCSDMQLQTGDYVFINECTGTDKAKINMLAFKITRAGFKTFTIDTGGAITIDAPSGVVFPLTRRILPDNSGGTFKGQTGDSITWYDGDPGVAAAANTGNGFVNFVPPLDNFASTSTTYLVGARLIIPFGSRFLAIGTYEATSSQIRSGSSGNYFGNRIRYCQLNPGSPFYSQGNSAANTLYPTGISLPSSFSYTAAALANQSWISNIQGFGGFIDLDTTDRIISAGITQGSLILGLETEQRRVSITGLETDPFSLQIINPDYGTASTHSTVQMDNGVLSVGEYGFLVTSSYNSKRFDEKIIEEIFNVNTNNNGFERICAARDFPNELVYFTYNDVDSLNVFPNRTIVFNYRNGAFSRWLESYTTYGIYKSSAGTPWEKLNTFTWENWSNQTWESGFFSSTYPYVAGITPQGYVMLKYYSSANDPSLCIQAISGSQITSPNHNLEAGMYVSFQAIGSNTPLFSVAVSSIVDSNNFKVSGDISTITVPGYEMVILDNFLIQTKQFQIAWDGAKKTRIGTQRYFLDATVEGEFEVDLLASQSAVPINNPTYPSVISSNIVRTRPDESLGLNDSADTQTQIWHRLASSVLGDTVQLQFTMSSAQMTTLDNSNQPTISREPWVLHAVVIDLYPSRILA